jgi:FkbM family methyltransferase
MIVKDESHIIEETLEKLLKKIKIDYWVICDTGSSDKTPEIVTSFFDKKNIKGELYIDCWKDFASNRTLALQRAHNKTDYLLVFDADDEIEGDLILPSPLTKDGYKLKIGPPHEITYERTFLVNNRKKWCFVGVLHEVILSIEPKCEIEMVNGDYYVVSGRKGARNKDPNKYYKDALILEKAFTDSIIKSKTDNNEYLYRRYCFYCANSYLDAQHYEKAIEWYKKFLQIGDWNQEKYVSCHNIFRAYSELGQRENGFYYLLESLQYDRERLECLYHLIHHYFQKGQFNIAYNMYLNVKDVYENNYLTCNFSEKLFYDTKFGDFHVPFYIILVSINLRKMQSIPKLFEIIFSKKYIHVNEKLIKNLMFMFQICVESIRDSDNSHILLLFESYILFLENNKFPVSSIMNNVVISRSLFTKTNKPNMLISTGILDRKWNYSLSIKNSLGGSETMVAFLSKYLSKYYNIYVVGEVEPEISNGVVYVSNNNLMQLIETIPFNTVIISRFIDFLELLPKIKTEHVYIWAHDTNLISNINVNEMLQKWNHRINGCICLTEWHKTLFEHQYPILINKICILNNGIDKNLFNFNCSNKIKNQFVYTSRSERGLTRLLELWPEIVKLIPDATLVISSYNNFPANENDLIIEKTISNFNNIRHYSKLNKMELYELLSKSEYWFYPCTYAETSCITAMEMMMSEVICIYYPVAGLIDTIGNYGFATDLGKELETIKTVVQLSDFQKNRIRRHAKVYSSSFDIEKKSKYWNALLHKPERMHIINLYNSKSNTLPRQHIEYLVKMKNNGINPKVIYDIGSCVGAWTNIAKQIWPDAKYILFDGFKDVEFIYQIEEYDYNIGVLSNEDDRNITWYENKIMPYGNSYYKENNDKYFPESCGKEVLSETLSTVIKRKGFPLPDLIKFDIQGCERDVILGSKDIVSHASNLIVEMQHENYNNDAPTSIDLVPVIENIGFKLITPLFCNNGPDGDYHFEKIN